MSLPSAPLILNSGACVPASTFLAGGWGFGLGGSAAKAVANRLSERATASRRFMRVSKGGKRRREIVTVTVPEHTRLARRVQRFAVNCWNGRERKSGDADHFPPSARL